MRKNYLLIHLPASTFIFFLCLSSPACAQKWQLKSYNIGVRFLEVEGFGNNPNTLGGLLKNPIPYDQYIKSIDWNTLFGSPGPQASYQSFISAEWHKPHPTLRFWKRHSIQSGVFITNKIVKQGMAIGNEGWNWDDSTHYKYYYKPIQNIRFAGAMAGFNKRFRLLRPLYLATGIHLLGSFAIKHVYKQQWDSSLFYLPSSQWHSTTTLGPDLKGKNYTQWQALIPLALEMNVYKQTVVARAEIYFGIAVGRLQKSYHAFPEANGLGFWIIYRRP